MSPRVTVLMSVYNGERFLRESIDSVLAQTFRDFELLLINDGSSDGSRAILADRASDARIRIIDNERNIGLTASLNAGLAAARGEYVARHDADDVAAPTRLEKQVRALDERPEIAVLGTAVRTIDEHGRQLRSTAFPRCTTPISIRWQLLFEPPFAHSSVMFRRSVVFEMLGGYDERYRTSQDFELWSRVARTHALSNLPEALIDFRSHGGSVSARYTTEGIEKVRETLRTNMIATLGPGDYEPWLDFWVTVNNPRTYGHVLNTNRFLDDLDAIARRFEERYEIDAQSAAEIRRQRGAALARVSAAIARENRRAAIRAFASAVRFAPAIAMRSFPRTAVCLMLPRTARTNQNREMSSIR